jgi:hypothetical protein
MSIHDSSCAHCGDRGWGIRVGIVRRCEVCCRFDDDMAARDAAAPSLTAFALRERPEATVTPDNVVRCPWCDHAPTNVGDDKFTLVTETEMLSYALVRVATGTQRLHFGAEDGSGVSADYWLRCPKCWKSFAPSHVLAFDFELDKSVDE